MVLFFNRELLFFSFILSLSSLGCARMVRSEGLTATPPPAKQLGVTKPISTAGPTEADLLRSRDLEKVCILNYLILKFSRSIYGHSCVFLVLKFCKFGCRMFQFLVDVGLYESKEESTKRKEVLGRIGQVNFWVCYMGPYNLQRSSCLFVSLSRF